MRAWIGIVGALLIGLPAFAAETPEELFGKEISFKCIPVKTDNAPKLDGKSSSFGSLSGTIKIGQPAPGTNVASAAVRLSYKITSFEITDSWEIKTTNLEEENVQVNAHYKLQVDTNSDDDDEDEDYATRRRRRRSGPGPLYTHRITSENTFGRRREGVSFQLFISGDKVDQTASLLPKSPTYEFALSDTVCKTTITGR